jgi:hypothetical protein
MVHAGLVPPELLIASELAEGGKLSALVVEASFRMVCKDKLRMYIEKAISCTQHFSQSGLAV